MRRTAVLAAIVVLVGCASDGRALRPPAPGATAPSLVTTTAPGQTTTTQTAPMTLTSTAFEVGQPIPASFTCDGGNASPPLAWGSVPERTVELVVTVTDIDANGFVHWVLTGIDRSVQALASGAVPDGVVEAKNDGGTVGWTGPCPPKGSGFHHYIFTLYALDGPSGVTAGMAGKEAIAAISKVSGITATLTGSYERA